MIVGTASAGPRTVAAAWYAPGLTGWRRAADARPGALDGPGNRAMNAVSATGRGFVAVGAAGDSPGRLAVGHRPDVDAGDAGAARGRGQRRP